MSRYVYTLHAEDKFKLPEIKKLRITKKKVEDTIENPLALDKSEKPVYIAVSKLSGNLSLCVAHRKDGRDTRIITFFPAEKGRYERKIL